MLSKQDKLQYGELLRQQIKEKEEARKAQKRQYTPQEQNLPNPVPAQIHQPTISMTPPTKPVQFKNPRELQKELLAKKMESLDYNPFGKVGGGAPNKHLYNVDQKQNVSLNQQNSENPTLRRNSTYEYGRPGDYEPQYRPEMERQNVNLDPSQVPPFPPYNQFQSNPAQYRKISTPEFLQGAYNNAQFISPLYAPPAPYGYIVEDNQIDYRGKIQLPQQPRPSYQSPYQPVNRPPEDYRYQQPVQNFNQRQADLKRPQVNSIQRQGPNQDNNFAGNAEQELFKKGGRNLLLYENQVPAEVISKKNEKMRLQLELKKQMEEAVRRKKEEEQKMREEDERLQRKNLKFLEQEKLRYDEELRGKQDKVKNVAEVNANQGKNNEPSNMKKQKFQKIREEVARREEEEQRQAALRSESQKQNKQLKHTPRPPQKNSVDIDEVVSVISSDTQMSRGFNTAISKEFFKKQKQKHKIQKFSEEMQKMRKQIANQGHQFHEQIDKLQREAERAKREKEMADQQIFRLKKELRLKMDVNNKKYLQDIYGGKVKIQDPFYADQVTIEQRDVNTLKPRRSQKLVLQEYNPPPFKEGEEETASQFANNSDMMSLIGDSKKIPLDFTSNETLSISKLGNFAKDTDYFSSKKNEHNPLAQRYHPQQSIQELDEERGESKQSRRRQKPKQELDLLLKSRSKSRGGWGEMSSVNDDIVVQIDKMLQPKERPKSHLSSMGERTLYTYQNDKLAKNKKQQLNMKRKVGSLGDEQPTEGTLNSLDKLIKKYM